MERTIEIMIREGAREDAFFKYALERAGLTAKLEKGCLVVVVPEGQLKGITAMLSTLNARWQFQSKNMMGEGSQTEQEMPTPPKLEFAKDMSGVTDAQLLYAAGTVIGRLKSIYGFRPEKMFQSEPDMPHVFVDLIQEFVKRFEARGKKTSNDDQYKFSNFVSGATQDDSTLKQQVDASRTTDSTNLTDAHLVDACVTFLKRLTTVYGNNLGKMVEGDSYKVDSSVRELIKRFDKVKYPEGGGPQKASPYANSSASPYQASQDPHRQINTLLHILSSTQGMSDGDIPQIRFKVSNKLLNYVEENL